MMHRNKSVDVHQFSMVPRADIPRSKFNIQKTHKTCFDAGLLIPIYVDEVLPGDSFNVRMTAFARLATPIFPVMDNLHLDSFFFFVPCRLVWDNWQKFQGEQRNPGDSTSYLVPQVTFLSRPAEGSLPDHFGIPVVGQLSTSLNFGVNALPFRAYNLIWNEWFRDENLQNSVPVRTDDTAEAYTVFSLLRRGKRHDYFTSCLPWPQKGESVSLPLGTSAPILSDGSAPQFVFPSDTAINRNLNMDGSLNAAFNGSATGGASESASFGSNTGLYADLSAATAATINQLRQSFQIQKVLERDARGGTRYTEIVRSHFGVTSPDARLQRPEYLGGGSSPIIINPIAQTSGSAGVGGYTDTPQGNLAGMGTSVMRGHGFSQSFTEHGYIIGLVCARADLTYQQGLRKMWSRRTRFDFYLPAFAALGEQAVLQKEIYMTGVEAEDNVVFGYQERWSEMRHNPSSIVSLMRSTATNTIDAWHLAQHFTTPPTLNATFIEEHPPVERVTAVGSAAAGQQFLMDCFFNIKAARPLPMYSVPGLIDHF